MSTAVYNAFRWCIATNLDDHLTMCFEHVRPFTIASYRLKMLKALLRDTDVLTISPETFMARISRFIHGGVYPFENADQAFSAKYSERPTRIATWCDPLDGVLYGNISSLDADCHQVLIDAGMGIDFSYWNQTDPDPSVSEEAWDCRQDVWHRIDLDNPVSIATLRLSVSDFYDPAATQQALFKYVQGSEFVVDMSRYEMNKIVNDLEKMGIFTSISSVLDAMHNPTYLAQAQQAAEIKVHCIVDCLKNVYTSTLSSPNSES